jgi:hypothetical protein
MTRSSFADLTKTVEEGADNLEDLKTFAADSASMWVHAWCLSCGQWSCRSSFLLIVFQNQTVHFQCGADLLRHYWKIPAQELQLLPPSSANLAVLAKPLLFMPRERSEVDQTRIHFVQFGRAGSSIGSRGQGIRGRLMKLIKLRRFEEMETKEAKLSKQRQSIIAVRV